MATTSAQKEHFFTQDRSFYRTLFPILLTISLQNLVAYSVNMADNMMLGSYSQSALSGAAIVNQVFFFVQQLSLGIGDGLVVLATQYWGAQHISPIRRLVGIALRLGALFGLLVFLVCTVWPRGLLGLFTTDEEILQQGLVYLQLLKYSFVLFIFSSVLTAALRSVGTVSISFYISIVSLFINVGINYALIFGKLGAPALGIRGAAIGTLTARIVELLILLLFLARADQKLQLFQDIHLFATDRALLGDYIRVEIPVMLSQILWAVSVPMQTAILGHLSSDAIAANSVTTTFYQYLKVIVQATSAASAVMIGQSVGRGDMKRVRADARTLSVIAVGIGLVLGFALYMLRTPLLRFYTLTPTALSLADQLIVVMSVIMVGMSYQMPVSMGVMRGAGDTKFPMYMNILSIWAIVMPLSFLAAFVWHWNVVAVVMVIQSDQIFKGVPVLLHFRKYQWVKKLTRQSA